ncbi:Transmembrane and coiled-coil domains protein 2-like protein [Dinothrombium tinctorium]|uniref:Transmembrane and coiled-coil domains protein 2-like protein n=1 Tax=Dinothrombium tinctorium TaxID=1965070 RepID=A0A3S3NVT8_9ACAR|nr:Transmembrane and coiled-coil domains protein 2-like protein [Dinothrombium tinctorium]
MSEGSKGIESKARREQSESGHSAVSVNHSNGTMDSNPSSALGSSSRDDLDALLPPASDGGRTKTAIEHLLSKINRTKEAIKQEQTSRDENVNEYLKLAANADKHQLQRIKSVFEKKNQKSAQTISQLQKKLESYNKRIRLLETYGFQDSHHRPKEMLRNAGQGLKDVGTNIKEGITGLSGGVIGSIKSGFSVTHTAGEKVITKPRDFFKSRFGKSVPEEANISVTEAEGIEMTSHKASNSQTLPKDSSYTHSHSTKCTSDEESSSITSGSGHIGDAQKIGASVGSSASPAKQHFRFYGSHLLVGDPGSSSAGIIDVEPLLAELRDRKDDCQRLTEEVEAFKTQFQAECALFHQNLQDERYRFERLEEQMNDLIELHQNEIENLKQGIGDMEEKVQYQSEERLRDIHEMLESCQTRISRMEHQQHQHLQQLVNLDSLENTNARALVLKLINVLLTILQVILLLVATLANIVTPFLQTRYNKFKSYNLLAQLTIFVYLVMFSSSKHQTSRKHLNSLNFTLIYSYFIFSEFVF